MSEIGCSCTVTLASGNREGVVKFVGENPILLLLNCLNIESITHILLKGETSFAKGEWIGVELFVAEGKNNGSGISLSLHHSM